MRRGPQGEYREARGRHIPSAPCSGGMGSLLPTHRLSVWSVGSAPGSDQPHRSKRARGKRLNMLSSHDNQPEKRAQTVRKREAIKGDHFLTRSKETRSSGHVYQPVLELPNLWPSFFQLLKASDLCKLSLYIRCCADASSWNDMSHAGTGRHYNTVIRKPVSPDIYSLTSCKNNQPGINRDMAESTGNWSTW